MTTNWQMTEQVLLALVLWREDRGDGRDGMRAVGHSIINRTKAGYGDLLTILEKKWQYSSMTATGDPELTLWPRYGDTGFDLALNISGDLLSGIDATDITNGATHYFNPDIVMPEWAKKMKLVATIGHHTYYRAITSADYLTNGLGAVATGGEVGPPAVAAEAIVSASTSAELPCAGLPAPVTPITD